ncbi:MAG: hypothetical protein OEV78_06335 [Spirochaetia bacterium]|nr:hypothetical protein [Spirochaetia bacterium]
MKYRFSGIFIFLFAVSSIRSTPYDQVAEELLFKMKSSDLKKVFTVTPFKLTGKKNGIDEEATATIYNSLKKMNIDIAERSDFPDLLKEIELSQQGVGKKEMDLENLLNASIAIVGTVHYSDDGSKKIHLKAIDLKTFLVLSTSEITIEEIENKFLLNLFMDEVQANNFNSIVNKIHFSFFIGSGWQSSFAAPVNTLDTVYLTGPPLLYWFHFGYPVNDQLILYLHLGNSNVFKPYIGASNDILRDSERRLNKVTITIFDAGAGLTWYLRPSRFFLTASVGDASALYKNTSEKIDINFGFGANAAIGYRQIISRSFAFGYILGFYYSHLEFSDISITIPTTQGYVTDNAFNINTVTVYLGAFVSLN